MVRHTQTIRQLLSTNCLSVFDHFVGLVLKRVKQQYYFMILQICDKKNLYKILVPVIHQIWILNSMLSAYTTILLSMILGKLKKHKFAFSLLKICLRVNNQQTNADLGTSDHNHLKKANSIDLVVDKYLPDKNQNDPLVWRFCRSKKFIKFCNLIRKKKGLVESMLFGFIYSDLFSTLLIPSGALVPPSPPPRHSLVQLSTCLGMPKDNPLKH